MKVLIAALMLVGPIHAWAGEQPADVVMRDRSSTQIAAVSDKRKVVVRIDTQVVGDDDPRSESCKGTTRPCRGVRDIQIMIDQTPLPVPISAYWDLGDLRSGRLRFSRQNDDVFLELKGGDASESFGVTIRFNRNRVISRKLFSMISPEQPLEETQYHQVGID